MQETPSLALGTSEVSLIDLTGAYASVRLGKAPVEPWGILDFKAAEEPKAFRVGQQVKPTVDLSQYQSDLLGLLQLVVERGTGREADLGTFSAGKTGTSQDNRDAWFVGFTEPLVVGVWVGNDDDTPMKGVTGGSIPARIWRQFMQAAMTEPLTGLTAETATAAGAGRRRNAGTVLQYQTNARAAISPSVRRTAPTSLISVNGESARNRRRRRGKRQASRRPLAINRA